MANHLYTSVIIGSGFSGIGLAISLKQAGIGNFVILEKANDVGGTWRENTYPGAECDIPSALYSYSFEPYPYWEYKWSHQPQIHEYITHCVDKYGLREHLIYNAEVTGANWQSNESYWQINCKDGTTYRSKTMTTAIGQLHHPSIPSLTGIDSFQGESWHSAKWNHDIDLTGKRIAVIGNAASAIQFIPQIAKKAKEITIFQRSANWMLPKQDRLYRSWEKKLVAKFPMLLRLYRAKILVLSGALFLMMKTGFNPLRFIYQKLSIRYIKKHIKDPKLIATLTPQYPLGAKRLLFSDDYYPTLSKSHVNIASNGIERINKNGVTTKDGSNYEHDIIIYATGFKANPFLLGLDIIGKNSLHIRSAWQDGPINFKGITIANFPNMFMMYGPNTNLGHSSIILMSEAQANYITKCIVQLEKNNWKSMDIKPTVMAEYHQKIQSRLKKMIWTQIDNSWYQSTNGNIPNNWPGKVSEYAKIAKSVEISNYNIEES